MKPKRIIIHHSLTEDGKTVSWDAIRTYHTQTNGWKDIGYHFGVELVNTHYEVLLGRMINVVGAHCEGHNSDSIGICFVGNFDNQPVPAEQWKVGVKLVRSLCDTLGIAFSEIHGHRDYSSKSCPGKLFDMKRFVQDVMKAV